MGEGRTEVRVLGGEGERLGWCGWKMREVRVVWAGKESG